MGLAASQARLLSITSRMSDNELRSQLINNAKMRLTSDSARVSDEYVAALNATKLMFSNFDTQGNEMYQDLTFNSLTAYSAYNNQYGIVNNAGEIMVSAGDAGKFEAAGGSLEKFLESYGLEQTTDYFDTLESSEEYLQNGIGWYDDQGRWQQFDVSTEELQAMYEGTVDASGKVHYGKTDSLNSIEYGAYQDLVSDYRAARDNYQTVLRQTMKGFLNGDANIIPGNTFTHNNKKFDDYYNEVLSYTSQRDKDNNPVYNAGTVNDLLNIFKIFADKVGLTGSMDINQGADPSKRLLSNFYTSGVNEPFLEILKLNLALASSSIGQTVTEYHYDPNGSTVMAEFDENGNFTGNYITPTQQGYLVESSGASAEYYEGFGYGTIQPTPPTDGRNYIAVTQMPNLNEDYSYQMAYSYTKDDGTIGYTHKGAADYQDLLDAGVELTPCSGAIVYGLNIAITAGTINDALETLYKTFRNNVLNNMSAEPFEQNNADVIKAREEYEKAAANLADFIYGEGNGQKIVDVMKDPYYKECKIMDYLDQPSWVLSGNIGDREKYDSINVGVTHYNPFNKDYQTTYLTEGVTTGNNYQVVKDLYLMDCMFEHYGTPVYTWIDKNDKNENAQAKATWYSNLFARMQKGYKVLGEGLQNNQEWLKFAFENGLVHMEQVNKSSEWVSTMYSNCSNITESTVDVDITIAEAKYNREMAKIEAKDKRYDIELKNIDTEHESLKQEYESVKKVITKNIENNMKLFQNA